MRNIGESRIYIVSELSADNEQWVNPDFGNSNLQTHYDNIKRMVKEKTGRAMQEKERERKGKNGKIIKVAGCSPIREGVLLIKPDTTLADVKKFGEECQRRWGITPLQIFLHKDEGHWLNGQPNAEDKESFQVGLFASQLKDWVNTHFTLLPDSIRQNIISTAANLIDKIQGVDTGSSSSAAAAVASSETAAKGFDFSSFSSPMSALWGTAKQIPSILVGTIVGIVCCCFMTSDYHTLRSLIMTQAGKRADAFIRTKQIIFSTLGKMIRAYGLIMCITFLEMVLGLSILKLFGIYENGYIFAIALITAVIDIVPVLGTGTVLIPWAIWMFFSGDVAMGIGLLVIYGVITVVRQIVEPKLVASQLGLPAFVTLMAMYIGSQLFGFVGLFLLPMTVMLLKVLNDDGVIHIFKVPPEEAAEFKAAKDKDEKTDAERKAKKREGIKKIKTGKKK